MGNSVWQTEEKCISWRNVAVCLPVSIIPQSLRPVPTKRQRKGVVLCFRVLSFFQLPVHTGALRGGGAVVVDLEKLAFRTCQTRDRWPCMFSLDHEWTATWHWFRWYAQRYSSARSHATAHPAWKFQNPTTLTSWPLRTHCYQCLVCSVVKWKAVKPKSWIHSEMLKSFWWLMWTLTEAWPVSAWLHCCHMIGLLDNSAGVQVFQIKCSVRWSNTSSCPVTWRADRATAATLHMTVI